MKGQYEAARAGGAGRRLVTVEISRLAFEALQGADGGSAAKASSRMKSAVRCYLGDRGTDRAAWPYPGFLRGSETRAEVPVQFDVESDLWGEFETEAATQGVSVDQLAEHAAFYFGAQSEAGNLNRRHDGNE